MVYPSCMTNFAHLCYCFKATSADPTICEATIPELVDYEQFLQEYVVHKYMTLCCWGTQTCDNSIVSVPQICEPVFQTDC